MKELNCNCTITKAMLYYTFIQYKLNIYRSIHFDQVGNCLQWNLGFALWDSSFTVLSHYVSLVPLHCFSFIFSSKLNLFYCNLVAVW